ncbi:hypothetical protein Agau_L100465 [Agrobacterium tumefaciens F2]|nr:hypothetical protein Agau_L100465 [Agrobacterium tumefaciens F2]
MRLEAAHLFISCIIAATCNTLMIAPGTMLFPPSPCSA